MTEIAQPSVPAGHVHGSAVAWCGRGILVRGASGAGKSLLVAGLLAEGGYLVADDVVRLQRRGQSVLAAPVPPPGLIELRGTGIFRLVTTNEVPVHLCVELKGADGQERLLERQATSLAGVELPCLRLVAAHAGAVAQILIALVARRAG